MTHGCGVITQKHTLAATASDLMKLFARRDTTTAVIVRLGNFHPVHARRLTNSLCVSEAGRSRKSSSLRKWPLSFPSIWLFSRNISSALPACRVELLIIQTPLPVGTTSHRSDRTSRALAWSCFSSALLMPSPERVRRLPTLGVRANDARMDTALATAIPPIRNAAADRIVGSSSPCMRQFATVRFSLMLKS
jgi:hypothetical protein